MFFVCRSLENSWGALFTVSSGVFVGVQRDSAVWGRATIAVARPMFWGSGIAVASAFAGRARPFATAFAGRARPVAFGAGPLPSALLYILFFGTCLGFAPRPELLDLRVHPLRRTPASLWGLFVVAPASVFALGSLLGFRCSVAAVPLNFVFRTVGPLSSSACASAIATATAAGRLAGWLTVLMFAAFTMFAVATAFAGRLLFTVTVSSIVTIVAVATAFAGRSRWHPH